jgi:hypothetical protein
MTYILKWNASLHGFEMFLEVQLVDELIRKHDASFCRLAVLVHL